MITSIENVHNWMNEVELTRLRFNWTLDGLRSVRFSVLATTGTTGKMFVLGAKGHNLFLVIDANTMTMVGQGLQIEETLHRIGRFAGRPNLLPSELVAAFVKNAKASLHPLNGQAGADSNVTESTGDSVALLSSERNTWRYEAVSLSKIEIETKVFFAGWRVNGPGSRTTPTNLEKLSLLGSPTISQLCEEHNISSRWSDAQFLRDELIANAHIEGYESFGSWGGVNKQQFSAARFTYRFFDDFSPTAIDDYANELTNSVANKLRIDNRMLTPQLQVLLRQLQVDRRRLTTVERALLQELRMLDGDPIIAARCLELLSRLPPQELPTEGRCTCCDRPL